MKNNWPTKKLGEVCDIYQPQTITSKEILKEGPYKVFGTNGVIGYYSKYNHNDQELIVGCRGTCGSVNFTEPKSWITGNAMVVHPKVDNLLKKFLFYYLQIVNLNRIITGTSQPQITRGTLSPIRIPLPPLKIQRQIVERLDAIKKAQELNDKQIALADELFQSLLHRELDPKGKNWNLLKLSNFVEKVEYGLSVSVQDRLDKNGVPILTMNEIGNDGQINYQKARKISLDQNEFKKFKLNKKELLFNWRNEKMLIGKTGLFDSDDNFIFASFLLRIVPNKKIFPEFLWYWLNYLRVKNTYLHHAHLAGNQASYNATSLQNKTSCPLIMLETQRKIVKKLSAVQGYKKKLIEQKQLFQELFDSVLNKSFKGQL